MTEPPAPPAHFRMLAPVRALRRRLLSHRRLVAAVLVGVAALLALHDLRAPAPAAIEVWTAARDLPGGVVLASGDLRRTPFAPGSVPAGAVRDARRLVGRPVAAPLRRGQPLTDLAVVGPALTAHDPGRVAVPARLADTGVADLLRVGDRVDLVAVDPDSSRAPATVAVGARVVAVPHPVRSDAAGAPTGRLVVFSVDPGEATDVAASGVAGFLVVTFAP